MDREIVRTVIALTTAIALLTCGTARADIFRMGSTDVTTAASFPAASTVGGLYSASGTNGSLRDGTIISYRFAGSGGTFALRVLRPTGGSFTGAGSSAPQIATATGTGLNGPFPTNLPIKLGDRFGLDVTPGATLGFGNNGSPESSAAWSPPLLDNGPLRAPDSVRPDQLAVQVTMRFCRVPEVRGLSPGKAILWLRGADCTVGQISRTKKRRKARRVVWQSFPPMLNISDTQSVDIKVSRKRKPRRGRRP